MKGSKDKTAQAGPVELGENELGEVAGGYELKNVVITSYQTSGTGDGTPDLITAPGPGGTVHTGAGGGPHVRVFNG